ncbi:MAG: phage protein GemA/Gp16 family protein [Pseudomonadota bacterium]
MQVINGGGEKSQNKLQRQRNGLLAKVHIAKKELGLDDKTYRDILRSRPWCVDSAADLRLGKLEALVNYFKSMGWKESPVTGEKESQIEALRERIMEVAAQMDNGAKRAQGLCKTICRTDRLEWCRDIGRLKRMLVIMEKIRAEEEGKIA